MKKQKNIPLKSVEVKDYFWGAEQDLVREVVLPYQGDILEDKRLVGEKSHAVENFRIAAGMSDGAFYGMVFQDSDVAKWLEAVSYSLAKHPDAALESRIDEVIDIVGKAQQPDGYLNTYFTVKEPAKRWTNLRDWHELYCAGHMIEAGVAHFTATGKRTLLDIVCRQADNICARFGDDAQNTALTSGCGSDCDGKTRGISGHEEIELALLRLYRLTGQERYRQTALYFLNERGVYTDGYDDMGQRRYNQSHAPVREQDVAVGHSVRALYLYTAMADMASETGDTELSAACERLWRDLTDRQMYVTGGLGATAHGEAFTVGYDLPNDLVYAETCASVAMVFFARRMLELRVDGTIADVIERELFNSVLSGMQLDGKRFFYVNPLEVVPDVSGVLPDFRHSLPERPEWYACACCPPNVARLIMSLGRLAWGENENGVFAHIFLGGEAEFALNGGTAVSCISDYPYDGRVQYTIERASGAEFDLAIHIPSWCRDLAVYLCGRAIVPTVADGYLTIRYAWKTGDTVNLKFEMPVLRLYAHTLVRADAGQVALQRGPFVYCFEEADNGGSLSALRLPRDAEIKVGIHGEPGALLGMPALDAVGWRESSSDSLYSEQPPTAQEAKLHAVPYYAWGNRGKGAMRVWIRE